MLSADEIVVFLGRYDLESKAEKGSTTREVSSIHVHPEWKIKSDKWDADLALLVLNEIVTFTNFIQPVCVPANKTVEKYDDGTVVSATSWKIYSVIFICEST